MTETNSWQRVCIKDVCESIIDCVNKTAPTVDYPTPYKMIRTTNVKAGWINLTEAKYVSEEIYEKWTRRAAPKKGDVILTREAPLGEVGMLRSNDTVFLGQRLVQYRANPKKLDNRFLLYAFQADDLQGQIKSFGSGATVEHMRVPDCEKLSLLLPSISTQKRIASILSAYDDLIENNTRRIKILEEMAQLLYREWFVNFRFPGHQDVPMAESELGLIPQGWEVRKLEELGLLARGKSKHRPRNDSSLYGGSYPFIQTGEVKQASLFITEYNQTYNDKGLAQSKLWEPGTLLITIAANIAETAILTFSACFPDSIIGFVPDTNKVSAEFIKYSIDILKLRMQNISRGTTQDNLSQEKIRIFNFLLPTRRCMKRFVELTQPMFQEIRNLLLRNRNLQQTRDLLLPKLISGEIDVESLDAAVETEVEELAA